MPTAVVFYTQPTNLDYLMGDVRLRFGDLTGDVYSDTIIRTALINSVKALQGKWDSKYQVFTTESIINPQPLTVPSGYIAINTKDGIAYIIDTITPGSIYRNPYLVFTQGSPPIIEANDESPIILMAVYILRMAKVSGSADTFVSWSTEDIRYSNLGAQRGLENLLAQDIAAIDAHFGSRRLGRAVRQNFDVIPII